MPRLMHLLFLAALAAPLAAQEQYIPAHPSGWVTDQTGKLSRGEVSRLDDQLAALKTSTGLVMGVVLLPTIGDYLPVEVATKIGRKWGVADTGSLGSFTKDLGLTLLIVPKSPTAKGRCFLAVAKGAEGIITDAQGGRLCRDMIPYFKQDQYAGGITTGITTIAATVAAARTEVSAVHRPATDQGFSGWLWFLIVTGVLALIAFLWWALTRSEPEPVVRAQARYPEPEPYVPQHPYVAPEYTPYIAPVFVEPPRRKRDSGSYRSPDFGSSDSGSSGSSDSGGGFGGSDSSYSGGGGGSDW